MDTAEDMAATEDMAAEDTTAVATNLTPLVASRLRIELRQFVDDGELLACGESTSG